MGLRLLRRGPAPAGRHQRAVPGPLVPGAAAALVAAADHWEEAAVPAYAGAAATTQPAPVIPAAPVLLDVPPAAPAAAGGTPPLVPHGHVATATRTEQPVGGPVLLGFADGAHVELDADDPRVRTFRAAAAALLESPRT
jgi:hypothetical protein